MRVLGESIRSQAVSTRLMRSPVIPRMPPAALLTFFCTARAACRAASVASEAASLTCSTTDFSAVAGRGVGACLTARGFLFGVSCWVWIRVTMGLSVRFRGTPLFWPSPCT